MSLTDLTGVLTRYRDASAWPPPENVTEDFSRVAQSAPPSHLANGLAAAFRSDETPSFGQMVSSLFGNSNGQQRAGILQRLLGALGANLPAASGMSGLLGLLGGGDSRITPDQANQIPPQAVGELAEQAKAKNPSIVDEAGEFYAQHPTLVQALGAGSLALIMSHLSKNH